MYRALVSFSGVIAMAQNEVREITDKNLIKDLKKAGYIEEVKSTDSKVLIKENDALKAENDALKLELEALKAELEKNVSDDETSNENSDDETSND